MSDPYGKIEFAAGFGDDSTSYDIVCAFEVAEHFSTPSADLKQIFARAESVCILSTELYQDQGSEWWYLYPSSGQHVFFYSRQALMEIGKQNGFHYAPCAGFHLFARNEPSTLQRYLLGSIFSRSLRLIRAYLAYRLSYEQAARDSQLFG